MHEAIPLFPSASVAAPHFLPTPTLARRTQDITLFDTCMLGRFGGPQLGRYREPAAWNHVGGLGFAMLVRYCMATKSTLELVSSLLAGDLVGCAVHRQGRRC